jgi:hypothetical protein
MVTTEVPVVPVEMVALAALRVKLFGRAAIVAVNVPLEEA